MARQSEKPTPNKRCAHCNAVQRRDDGWDLYQSKKQMFWIKCRCGISSRLFDDPQDAINWWNMRAGRLDPAYRNQIVSVTHKPNLDIPQVGPKAPQAPDLA